MDSRRADRLLSQRGATSVQFLIASGLALVFFVALANLVVVQYAKGAGRSALDQGVRVGAVTASSSRCEERVAEVFDNLLGGEMRDALSFSCAIEGNRVFARSHIVVTSWTPLTGDFGIDLTAEAVLEPAG